jgi:hypothetical protein
MMKLLPVDKYVSTDPWNSLAAIMPFITSSARSARLVVWYNSSNTVPAHTLFSYKVPKAD